VQLADDANNIIETYLCCLQVMLRPESVIIVHVHLIEDQNIIDMKNNPNVNVSENEALLFHYRNTNIDFNTSRSNKCLQQQYVDVIQERINQNWNISVEIKFKIQIGFSHKNFQSV